MQWAEKRRLQYFLGFVGVLAVLIIVPAAILLYQGPTCFDGKKNQQELGIDCSGPCSKLCSSNAVAPVTEWQQTFQVIPGIYTAVAYIQNTNREAEAKNASYTFTLYDSQNNPILERKGSTYIPAGRSFAVIEPGIRLTQTPARTLFEWDKNITWFKAVPQNPKNIEIRNQLLSDTSTTPLVNARVYNNSLEDISRVDAVAIVYDSRGNAFAASKTFVKDLEAEKFQPIVFTWPRPFPVIEELCKAPADVIVAVDRSGSMASEKANPPEPLTSVKNAASLFIERLTPGDKAGVLSFATHASLNKVLSTDLNAVKNTINAVAIESGGTQFTNIADAIVKAQNEFASGRHTLQSKKVLVLLTDGVATYPEKAGNPRYASEVALQSARDAKQQNIEIFTIGLGQGIDSAFLRDIASGNDHYFNAPTTEDLIGVYSKVAESLCKIQAVRVEIIATIPPQ